MKICVFGAASARIDGMYTQAAEKFGALMAERGHTLVFGAGAVGIMGAVARGVKEAGGVVHGVIPQFFVDENVEPYYKECDEIVYTQTMAERKQLMEDAAEAFVIFPGGIGTLEEFFEAFTLFNIGRHKKPICIYNINGHYDTLKKFLYEISEGNFVTKQSLDMCKYCGSAEEVFAYLENYRPTDKRWNYYLFNDGE